jgi:hypothetical protein
VDGAHVVVTEYVDGSDLETLVHKTGRLPVALACSYIRQAALGLKAAHERGVFHRNLKPSNLLIAEGGGEDPSIKLVDFGLSGVEVETGPDRAIPAGFDELLGTVDFLAPEQVTHSGAADARTDVFSLGCCLHYLLTARPPFAGPTALDRLLARRDQKAPPLRALRPDVPAALGRILAQMLAPNPGGRYETAGEVAAALEPFCRNPRAAAGATSAGDSRSRFRPQSPLGLIPLAQPVEETASGADGDAPPVPPADRGWMVLGGAFVGLVVLTLVGFMITRQARGPRKSEQPGQKSVQLAASPAPVLPKAALKTAEQAAPTPPAEAKPKPESQPAPKREPRIEAKVDQKPVEEPTVPRVDEVKPVPKSEQKPPDQAEPAGEDEPAVVSDDQPDRVKPPETRADPKPQPQARSKPEPAQPAIAARLPVPSPAAQAKAEKLIKDVFQPEYARLAAAGLKSLSAKLYQQALETYDDMDARFVLLREASTLSAQAGDLETAFRMIERMRKEYAVDPLLVKTEALRAASREARTSLGKCAVAEAALPLADRAVDADRYEVALDLVALAESTSRRCASADLDLRIKSRDREIRATHKEYARIKPLIEVLAKASSTEQLPPADALAAGKFLCFMKGHWDKGLPLLARAGDASLSLLAKTDLAGPVGVDAQVKLGDRWWELSEAESGIVKKQMQRRACSWYKREMAKLKGLTRTKVERRIKQVSD